MMVLPPQKMWESAYVKTNVKLMGRHEKSTKASCDITWKQMIPHAVTHLCFVSHYANDFFFLPPLTHACWCFLHPVDSKVTSTWKWNAPYYLFMKIFCIFVLTGCSEASSKTARFAEPVILGVYVFLSRPEQILIRRSFKLQPYCPPTFVMTVKEDK